jgi:plastocyanin
MADSGRKWILAISLLFTSLLNSCAPGTPPNKADNQAPAKPKYQVYTVDIKDMQFVPDSLVVNKGDEVVFVNRDMVNHCVTENKNNGWTSGPLQSGETYLLVARESANYYCSIHMVMKGRIIVR